MACSRWQATPRAEGVNQDQDASALGAAAGSLHGFFDIGMFPWWMGFDRTGTEPFSGLVEPRTVARAEQAVISPFDESVR